MAYIVEIVTYDGHVHKTFEPQSSLHNAERLKRGVEINLNHEKYYVRIEEQSKAPTHE